MKTEAGNVIIGKQQMNTIYNLFMQSQVVQLTFRTCPGRLVENSPGLL